MKNADSPVGTEQRFAEMMRDAMAQPGVADVMAMMDLVRTHAETMTHMRHVPAITIVGDISSTEKNRQS